MYVSVTMCLCFTSPWLRLAILQSPWQSEFDRPTDLDDGSEEEDRSDEEEEEHEAGEIFADYRPIKLPFGRPHPDSAVETASLAAVDPPDITYQLHIQDLIDEGKLSGLQLESIVYACQRHEQLLPSGNRCGFFIGDGALLHLVFSKATGSDLVTLSQSSIRFYSLD